MLRTTIAAWQLRPLSLILALCLLAGCPPREQPGDQPATDASVPSAPLPAQGKLISYGQLKLGQDSLALAQVYNAPEGKGDGFQRIVQDFDGVQHHIVKFDEKAGAPSRRLVLALLRDELYEIVERRDGLSAEQAAAWRGELIAAYGEPASMPVAGAQWSWGPENGVLLTFTQDNASEKGMSANVVLVYKPYEEAAYSYLADWQQAHPDYKAEELPF